MPDEDEATGWPEDSCVALPQTIEATPGHASVGVNKEERPEGVVALDEEARDGLAVVWLWKEEMGIWRELAEGLADTEKLEEGLRWEVGENLYEHVVWK